MQLSAYSRGTRLVQKIILLAIFTRPGLALSDSANSAVLSLQDFLTQVQNKNGGIKSAQQSTLAATLELEESQLLTRPNLYFQYAHQDDQKPSTLFQVQDTVTDIATLGVSETTSYGIAGKLHYDLNNLAYTNFGFAPGVLSSPSFSQGSPVLELTLSLWRNFAGHEISSQVEAGAAATEAKKHQQSFALQSLLSQAEASYWSLNLARESVKIAKDSAERARLMVEWNYKKSQVGLADYAEYLQAQAAYEARKVDLKNSENDLITASRNFNSYRGVPADEVSEGLQPLDPAQFRDLKIPSKMDDREDVKAALAQARLAQANAKTAVEKYKPTFEVFGLAATNNPTPTNLTSVYADSFNSSRPTLQIGVRLNTPLDFGAVSDVKKCYLQDQLAADEDVKKKRFDQNVAWTDLQDRYAQALNMLGLYEKLEKVQLDKLVHEKDRRAKGRTTTQQVLNFELDYEQAQLAKVRVMAEMLQIVAQMKLYGGVQ